MANPFLNNFDSDCIDCGSDMFEGDLVFVDEGEFICEDCAMERDVICECGNYKKSNFSNCFNCK